jgi:hypothetical protein
MKKNQLYKSGGRLDVVGRGCSVKVLLLGFFLIGMSGLLCAQSRPEITQLTRYAPSLAGSPSIAVHRNYAYIVFTDGGTFKGKITRYNLTTGSSVTSDDLFPTIGENDASHNDAAIAIDGDGFIHVMIGMHNDPMKYYKSTSPEAYNSFVNLSTEMPGYNDTGLEEKLYTYPTAATASNGDVVFVVRRNGLFYDEGRKEVRSSQHFEKQDLFHYDLSTGKWNFYWIKGKADDNGDRYRNAYMSKIFADDNNGIHIGTAWSWYHNGNNTFQRGTYLKFNAATGTFHKADGTDVTSDLPIYVDDTDGSVDFFFNSGQPWGKITMEIQTPHLALNQYGHPVVAFSRNWEPTLSKGADDRDPNLPDPIMERTISAWDGSKWVLTDRLSGEKSGGRPLITYTGGQLNTYSRDNSNRRWIISSIDGGMTWPGVYSDGGTSWMPQVIHLNDSTDLMLQSQYLKRIDYPIPDNAPPFAHFSSDVSSVIEGGTITFFDLSTNGATSWNWSFAGGAPSISTEQNPAIVYNTAGVYDVILTVANKNGSSTITKNYYVTVSEEDTALPSLMANPDLKIYPNPVSDRLFLQFMVNPKNCYASIYDLSGRMVYYEKGSLLKNVELDVTQLRSGVYLLVLDHDGHVYQFKFQKL